MFWFTAKALGFLLQFSVSLKWKLKISLGIHAFSFMEMSINRFCWVSIIFNDIRPCRSLVLDLIMIKFNWFFFIDYRCWWIDHGSCVWCVFWIGSECGVATKCSRKWGRCKWIVHIYIGFICYGRYNIFMDILAKFQFGNAWWCCTTASCNFKYVLIIRYLAVIIHWKNKLS